MNDYVITITFAIIFCVGINLLVPSPKYMGIMKIICGVFVVYTILSPIKNIINYDAGSIKIKEYIDKTEFSSKVDKSKQDFENAMTASSAKIIEDAIKSDVSKMQNTDIEANLLGDTVYVSGVLSENADEVIEYIDKQYGLKTVFR